VVLPARTLGLDVIIEPMGKRSGMGGWGIIRTIRVLSPPLGHLTALSVDAVMGSRARPFLHILPCRSLGGDYHLINRRAIHVTAVLTKSYSFSQIERVSN
jgi:hypothetical protein